MKEQHCSRCHEVGHNVMSCTKPVVRKLAPGVSGQDLANQAGGGVSAPQKGKPAGPERTKVLALVPSVKPVVEHELVLQLRLRVQLELG